MNEQDIRNTIRGILSEGEDEEKPKKRKKSGTKAGEIGLSTGRGGFTKVVADVGALATEKPKQLMDNLKIKSSASGYNGVVKILKQAFEGTDAMKQAYGGLSKVTKGTKNGLQVSMGELDARNGAKFIHHTLMGAIKAGKYSLDVPLQIQVVGNNIVVYTSTNKNSWETEE